LKETSERGERDSDRNKKQQQGKKRKAMGKPKIHGRKSRK